MSRPAPRPLSLALSGLTDRLEPLTTLARVQALWPEIAGAAISGAAQPTAENHGVLTLSCSAAVWAQELDMMASELLARLNSALGAEALTGLRCKTV